MRIGVQFTGTLQANQTQRWYTFNWPADWHVVWNVVSTTPKSGAPEVEWSVAVERATAQNITYWITVKNLINIPVNIEARYAIMNQ